MSPTIVAVADGNAVTFGEYSVSGLGRVNVLLGKNGCGKSTILRELKRNFGETVPESFWGKVKYVTPERAGSLNYDPNIDNNMYNDAEWLSNTRLVNQFNQFKQQTMAQYRQLEVRVSRLFQAAYKAGEPLPPFFSDYGDRINLLLDNIRIKQAGQTFKIYDKSSSTEIRPNDISSGESELIALAIEILVFATSLDGGERSLLVLDEPDVHLHPDLQARLIKFLTDLVVEFGFDILLATHSTPVIGELSTNSDIRVCFMRPKQKTLEFGPVDSALRELLPVFGAHPLTQIFNATRTLLVEGDDDVRIWQQAVKTANGKLKVTPVGCGGLPYMNSYEQSLARIVQSVYDNGVAYSLRDRDDSPEDIVDTPPVTRMRLSCRASENLILSDQVLSAVDLTWEAVHDRISEWCATEVNLAHNKYAQMKEFLDSGCDRKMANLKEIRMLLVGQILATNKPWEVLVGQAIGNLAVLVNDGTQPAPHSLRDYLGHKVFGKLLAA